MREIEILITLFFEVWVELASIAVTHPFQYRMKMAGVLFKEIIRGEIGASTKPLFVAYLKVTKISMGCGNKR